MRSSGALGGALGQRRLVGGVSNFVTFVELLDPEILWIPVPFV